MEQAIKQLSGSSNPFARFLGLVQSSSRAMLQGRSREALRLSERAAGIEGLPAWQRGAIRNRIASVLLRQGQARAALDQVKLALVDSTGRPPEFETLQLLAIANAALGQKAESEKALALLESRLKILPGTSEVRRVHWARGEIARLAGDNATAGAELATAAETLPPHGPVLGPPSPHAELWYAAAVALIQAGRDDDAARYLERLQAGHDRVFALDAYVRSHYLLAQIAERRGDRTKAREQYARFLELWRDGDLERAWVADALKKAGR
jgi:tetratricopeptide (TPR) repeat protein